MNTMTTNWEDDENNRRVEMLVQYELADNNVVIESVTPMSVNFIDPADGSIARRLLVWTEGGRQLLLRTLEKAMGADWVQSKVAESVAATA